MLGTEITEIAVLGASLVDPNAAAIGDVDTVVAENEESGLKRAVGTLDLTAGNLSKHLSVLEAAGLEPKDLDLVVCGTITPEMVFPSTACFVGAALGLAVLAAIYRPLVLECFDPQFLRSASARS